MRKLEGDVPHRVFVRGRAFPGLAMSRAIGDQIANAVGVSSEPDVNVFPIEANDEFVILASDGVWEFLKPKTVGEAAHQRGFTKLKESCEYIAEQAWKHWLHNEINVVDDITVIMLWLSPPDTTNEQ